jgi:hypothetical protein
MTPWPMITESGMQSASIPRQVSAKCPLGENGAMTARHQCPICGAQVEPRAGRGRPAIYDRAGCRKLAWYRRHRAQVQAQPPEPWTAEDQARAGQQLAAWMAALPDDPLAGLTRP